MTTLDAIKTATQTCIDTIVQTFGINESAPSTHQPLNKQSMFRFWETRDHELVPVWMQGRNTNYSQMLIRMLLSGAVSLGFMWIGVKILKKVMDPTNEDKSGARKKVGVDCLLIFSHALYVWQIRKVVLPCITLNLQAEELLDRIGVKNVSVSCWLRILLKCYTFTCTPAISVMYWSNYFIFLSFTMCIHVLSWVWNIAVDRIRVRHRGRFDQSLRSISIVGINRRPSGHHCRDSRNGHSAVQQKWLV